MSKSERQSFLRYPLSHVLANGSNVRVLRCLVQQPQPLAVSQLSRLTGLAAQSVRNVLGDLEQQGLLRTLGESRSRVHALRKAHPLAVALSALFQAEKACWDSLLAELQNVLEAAALVRAAWLYGSVARGEDRPGSDLDLAVVIEPEPGNTERLLRDRVAELGLERQVVVSLVVLTTEDLRRLVAEDSSWWQAVKMNARTLKGAQPRSVHEQLQPRPSATAA